MIDGTHITRRDFVRSALVAVAVPGVLGCATTPTDVVIGSRLTARPGAATRDAPRGLQPLGLGSQRDGYLYVPPSYSPARAAPLFVALHGAGGSAEDWGSYTARADARGCVLLVPDSRGTTWDLALGGFGPDVQFLNDALKHTFARCTVDPARIALGGFSDGASYALSLGVANGDLFPHLAAFSPGFLVTDDPPAGMPRVFVAHGYFDRVLVYSNTDNYLVPLLRDSGYDVTFLSFEGGHEVPAAATEAMFDWFLG